jgi:aspartate/methionine/tyrosine aminotransferase
MNQRLLALKPYPMGVLAAAKERIAKAGGKVFDFGTGDPIEPTAPAIRAAFRAGLPEVSQYPSVRGGAALRRAFATWYEGRFGIQLDPDSEVLPSQGSKEAIFHLPMVLVEPHAAKHAVAYPEPGYPVYEIGT